MASALFLALGLSPINDTLHFEKNDIDASQKNCGIKKKISPRYFKKKWPEHSHILFFFSIIYLFFNHSSDFFMSVDKYSH